MVPIANPAHASSMTFLGACVALPRVGRVLLLNVATLADDPARDEEQLDIATDVLRQSMSSAMRMGVHVECLATAAANPWAEIERVAHAHHCASVLLGMAGLSDSEVRERLERLADQLPGHIIILRSPPDWQPRRLRRVLIPVGGRVVHNVLRARLLGGIKGRSEQAPIFSYLLILPTVTTNAKLAHLRELWSQLANEESGGGAEVRVVRSDDVAAEITAAAAGADLLILGLSRKFGRHRVFGPLVTQVVNRVPEAIMIVGQSD